MTKEQMAARIEELEEEVRNLKRQLAARPTPFGAFNTRPFTPVPKSRRVK